MDEIIKSIVVFMNNDVIEILNQAEEMELIEIHKMRISQKIPTMVEFEMIVESEFYEYLMTALNKETLAFELIRD